MPRGRIRVQQLLFVWLWAGVAWAQPEPAPRLRATPLSGTIVIDGRLDEAAWAQAEPIELRQHEPVPGAPTPYATEVRVLVGTDAVYFGFRCRDPEPGKILVRTWARDGEQEDDDRISIVLDTFLDQRTGYWFRFNAVGARQDGLIAGANSTSADWDGLWSGRTTRDAGGWSAEIELPVRALRFGAGDSWGMNVSRYVGRDRTSLRWAAIELDASPIDMTRVGRLEGLSGLRPGRGLAISPYALGRIEREGEPRQTTASGDVGADLSYNLTPQLGAVVTLNTDFAETEVDARQVNLTRFPLFFQEKRPFFLEGSNLFEFGLGLEEDFVPFYSRRVGLFEGEPVPIEAGVKLVGRAGRFGVAALGTRTGDVPAAPGSNIFSGRLTYEAAPGLRVGVIATDGEPSGVGTNRLLGADTLWQSSSFRGDKNLAIGIWGAKSSGDTGAGSPTGWGLRLDYPNDRWDLSFRLQTFGAALDPALGFLPRPGTRQWRGGAAFQPRPAAEGRFGWARQFFYELFYSRIERTDGEVESWRLFTAPLNVTTQGGARVELNWAPQFERLAEPFEIADGIVIPPGEYEFYRFRIELFTPRTHSWRIGTSTWFGDFYDGQLVELGVEGQWTPLDGRLSFDLASSTIRGDLPQGDFTLRVDRLRGTWAFSPDLVLSSFVQYDSESENLGLNLRLRWTIRSGSDLFVVWTRGWLRSDDEGGFGLRPSADELVVKLRWTFLR